MKERETRKTAAILMAIFTVVLFLPGFVVAGDLEPSGPPTTGTMHTLDEIYTKLETIESSLGSSGSEGAPVAKTGQTTSYAAGDDGDLQKGVAWPNPRFTDNGDGTVTDNLTGLIWLKIANCDGLTNWADALTYCANLASGSCGLTDGSVAGEWRLPNAKEMQSLIDFGYDNPALPSGHPFTGVQSNYYWSGSTYAGITGRAWVVGVFHGAVDSGGKSANVADVWPVRGGN